MERRQADPMGTTEWTMLLALSALWGSSFFFFKILGAALPLFTVVLGRVGLAAIILNLFLWLRRDPMRASLPWRQFVVMGTLNNVIPFSLIVWGETRVPSGLASILNATTPIFAVVAAHFLTKNERMTWGKAVGVMLGFLGVVTLIGPDALRSGPANLPGEAACLLAALSYAFAGIYGRRFKGLPSLHAATGQLTAATMIILPIAAVTERFWALPMPNAGVWEALGSIALLCTVLAYILYFSILATAGATNLLLVTFLLPVSALLLGCLALGEHVEPASVLGLGIIGAGLAAIDGRPIAALRARFFADVKTII